MPTTVQEFTAATLTEISAVIGGTEYAKAVASVRFTPAQTVNTFKGGTPDAVFSSMTKPVFSCAMRFGQDMDDVASLTNYLLAHAGQEVPATFRFNSGATIAADLLLAAPELGGDIDSILDSTITHGVSGVPVLTPPAAG